MTTKEEYFNNEAKRLSTLNYNLYTKEKIALSEEEYAEYVKAFKEARNKFRNDYYIYAQSLAKKMAQEEFDGETGKNYIAKLDKADFNKLLFYQNNVNHNLELYEDWAKKYTLGGCSSCFNRSNIDERISINDLKDLWFISLLKTVN
jgi:hypothetical protein